jgi:hypothetical protein
VEWHEDGPALPVEFARKSSDGRITLVLLTEGPAAQLLWSVMQVTSAEEARRNLAAREKCAEGSIGYWPSDGGRFEHSDLIGSWAASKGIVGVVWTALGPKFDSSHSLASADEIVSYLRNLEEPTLSLAREYVRKTPPQIRTPYRAVIERELEWTAISST